jgi:hypothetical protein
VIVKTQDLVGTAVVESAPSASPQDKRSQLVRQRLGITPSTHSCQALFDGSTRGDGDALPSGSRQLSSQPIGFLIFDVERHASILQGRYLPGYKE